MNEILSLLIGIALLYLGGDALVRGAASLAYRLGMSPLVVGLTVVAFGTSAPELVVSVSSAIEGQGDIAVGNVIGSNICNVGLILGVAALLTPMPIQSKIVKIDLPILLFVSGLAAYFLFDLTITRSEGIVLALGLLLFIALTFYFAKGDPKALEGEPSVAPLAISKSLLFIGIGLTLLIFGGDIFVEAAVKIALTLGVSNAVIGLTVVAIGTSLPELATSIIAALKRESDIAVGNVVGSNIFNILCVLGLSATVSPLSMGSITWFDITVMSLFSLALLPLCRSGWILSRKEGAGLLLVFMGYLFWQFLK